MELDVLVVGSGVAGLSALVRLQSLDNTLKLGVVTKGALDDSTTRFAQGGVAAVLSNEEDSVDSHLADTLQAGAGLCDVDAVKVLVNEGPKRVEELIALGAVFDKAESGNLSLAREGGHSFARVVHANGLATGQEIERALVEAIKVNASAIYEGYFAKDLLIENSKCIGISAINSLGELKNIRAKHTILASGGAGQLYSVTTNPREATGDGIAMAIRSRVPIGDVEFIQFHPTALHHPFMPRPLLSEALRGHGALIKDSKGKRFVDELAPRDIVSFAMAQKMVEENSENVWLDATSLVDFENRFPNISISLEEAGLDPSKDLLPIAPAAHYISGGVLTDLNGASGLPGLWAAGEVALSGVHGANRLASNSLLEGLVFGARTTDAILSGQLGPMSTGAMRALLPSDESRYVRGHIQHLVFTTPTLKPNFNNCDKEDPTGVDTPEVVQHSPDKIEDTVKLKEALQHAMTNGAGVVRNEISLKSVEGTIDKTYSCLSTRLSGQSDSWDLKALEVLNLTTVAKAAVVGASLRHESRGAHRRTDFEERDDTDFLIRTIFK